MADKITIINKITRRRRPVLTGGGAGTDNIDVVPLRLEAAWSQTSLAPGAGGMGDGGGTAGGVGGIGGTGGSGRDTISASGREATGNISIAATGALGKGGKVGRGGGAEATAAWPGIGGEEGNRLLLPGRESSTGGSAGSAGGSTAVVFSSMWPQFGQYRPAGDSTISCWQTGHFIVPL
jgi:hypothetical protein